MTVQLATCFHRFNLLQETVELPHQFTYPFCYEPHPLSIAAAQQVQQQLITDELWQRHRTGYPVDQPVGKMFGVLVVQHPQGELGFLAAFSGKLADSNDHLGFVPPVYDILDHENVFQTESRYINQLNNKIEQLSESADHEQYKQTLAELKSQAEKEISELQQAMIITRRERKIKRAEAEKNLSTEAQQIIYRELAAQSVAEKHLLAEKKSSWQQKIADVQHQLDQVLNEVSALKAERKQRSYELQHSLFSHYRFLNANGDEAVLIDLFKDTLSPIPPAGSGECAAPKLLQFAYQHHLKPISMAEFWWGEAPRSALRRQGKFYPSCNSKCLPILTHMLQGLNVEDNPLLATPCNNKDIEIIFQDDAILVINKPEEMLSIPGVHIEDSAFTRVQSYLGQRDEGPFVVHRLDMSTSGLLVFALTKRANRSLQKQFIGRSVEKSYIAQVEGMIGSERGEIHLPLAADLDDKPRQLVCEKRGKPAETVWQVISRHGNQTKLCLQPKTGRTHQLRVHCAHPLGLNAPIVGDDLYGDKGERLYLHAAELSFDHPYTKERLTFTVKETF